MNFCASDWEGHIGFPSTCKTKLNFSMEAPSSLPHDVFEEQYCKDGQLQPRQKQPSSWAANSPFQATRDHGVAPLHVGGYAASLDTHVDTIVKDTSARTRPPDGDMIAWLQYPPDVELHAEKMYSNPPVVPYSPSLSLEKSDGALYHAYTLMGSIERERHCTQTVACTGPYARSFGTSFQSPNLSYTSDTQSPKPIVSPKAAASLSNFDPYVYAHNSMQSLARLAAEWEPDAGIPSLQAVVDGGKHIHQQNAGACMSTDTSLESTVTGISLQGPSVLVDPHVTECIKAASATLHQVHEAVPMGKPDAITHNDIMRVLHSTDMGCADGVDIKTFSNSNRTDKSGDSGKTKVKDSNGSESQTKDLVNQHRFSQRFSTKRSRAAEIHNKSERKRREKINKKLKVLQELIPNANKTDKASLLGEAIKYLKALQLQIMVMSYMTGIPIPPMLMSQGMLQPYVLPHMGLEFGAGFIMNTNANDASVAMPASFGCVKHPL